MPKSHYKSAVGTRQIYRRINDEIKLVRTSSDIKPLNTTSHQFIAERNIIPQCNAFNTSEFTADNNNSSGEFVLINHSNDVDASHTTEIINTTELSLTDSHHTDAYLKNGLKQWAIENKVKHGTVNSLLSFLKTIHPRLPLDARTLLETPSRTPFKELTNGHYYHHGLEFNLTQFILQNNHYEFTDFQIAFNMDGIPLFRSSKLTMWPILGHLKNISSAPFVVGVFIGKTKPSSVKMYLEDFVNELNKLLTDGLIYDAVTYPVKIHSFVCDSQARAFVKCTKSPGGYSCCDRCTEVGSYFRDKVILKGVNAPKRSDQSFLLKTDSDHHIASITSPLIELNVGLVSKFSLDYMHSVCLGVMRKLLVTWVGGDLPVRLRAGLVDELSLKLVNLKRYVPKEFNRRPRSLRELSYWKATEFRNFLLYFGPVVLKKIIDKSIFEHFMLFHYAISVLVSPFHIKNIGVDIPQECLKMFVLHCINIYGPQFMIYNIHIMCHLTEDVRRFGALDVTSAFVFENYLGQLKGMIRSPTNAIQQIHRRLIETTNFSYKIYSNKLETQFFLKHRNGPLLDNVNRCQQFKRMIYKGTDFEVNSHSIANSTFLTKCGYIAKLKNIIKTPDNKIFLICQKYLQPYLPLYDYPFSSQNLNIQRICSTRMSENVLYEISDIFVKCMILPYSHCSYVVFPLLHDPRI